MLIKLQTYNLLYFGITADLVFIVNFPDARESLKKVCETNKQTNKLSEETNNTRALSKPKF